MASLSSSSTLAEIRASYADNASYEEEGSVEKARAFLTACKLLVARLYTIEAADGAQVQREVRLIAEQESAARKWLQQVGGAVVPTSTTSPRAKHISLEDFR